MTILNKVEKYLFVMGSFGAGGTERVVTLLANKLVDNGHKVTVLSTGTDKSSNLPYQVDNRIRLIDRSNLEISDKIKVKSLCFLRRLTIFIKKNCITTIIFMNDDIAFLTVPLVFYLPCKLFIAIRNDPMYLKNHLIKRVLGLLFGWKLSFIFQNEQQFLSYSKNIYRPHDLTIVANPVTLFKYSNYIPAELKHHLYQGNKIYIAIASKFYQKGVDISIQGFLSADIKGYALLILIGSDNSSSLQSYVNKLLVASGNPVNKSILILPRINYITSLFPICDALLFSSRYEGMPNLLLESYFFSVPTILHSAVSRLIPCLMRKYHVTYDGENDSDKIYNLRTRLEENLPRNLCRTNIREINNMVETYNKEVVDKWIKILSC